MNPVIVPFGENYLNEVAQLEQCCFSAPWTEKSLRLLLSENAIAFVCLIEDTVCGYCGALCVLDEGDITSIAVLPEYRRIGIATALLEHLILTANTKGIKTLTLEVRENNSKAIELYEKFNFLPVGRVKSYYKNPTEDAIIMKRSQERY